MNSEIKKEKEKIIMSLNEDIFLICPTWIGKFPSFRDVDTIMCGKRENP
jgi:hypothetical protein